MLRVTTKRALRLAFGLWGAGLAAVLAASLYVQYRYMGRIRSAAEAPEAPVALVFGAGLSPNGEPSRVLAERMDAAIALHRSGKVKRLLLSGNSERYHDETRAMRQYALQNGLRADEVLSDPKGLSTFDTCVRARDVFGVRSALLVTQRFHLPRALYIANSVGIDAHGVPADGALAWPLAYELRELISRPLALWMVMARPPPGR